MLTRCSGVRWHTPICRLLTLPAGAPVGSGTLVTAAPTETGTTVASSSNTKAIAGGIGGAVAFVVVVVGAVILHKTCRTLKEKGAAKPDAIAHELQRKDRADALKLGAGASLGTIAPPSRLVSAGRCVQVGREQLRLRPPLCFRPDSMQQWWLRSARYARCPHECFSRGGQGGLNGYFSGVRSTVGMV